MIAYILRVNLYDQVSDIDNIYFLNFHKEKMSDQK